MTKYALDFRRILISLCLVIIALLVGCTGCGDRKDATDGSSRHLGFNQTKGMADSLYSTMQFRDAYDLYLQLLGSKEAQTDSVIRMNVLNDLCMTSELAGHKAEQTKWLQQMIDLAMQTGNDYYQSLASVTMGQNLFYEGSREKGIRNIIEAIDLMEKTDRENTDHLMHGYLNMLAAIYHEKEQEQTIMEQEAENARQRYLLFSVLAVLVAVTALALVIIRKNRIISRKNKSLAAQITEAINYKQMYWDEKLAQAKMQTPIPADDSDDPKELTDEQLFRQINQVVMDERLYLDPNFGRQTIMERFELSKERVGAVFSQGSDHARLNNYILQLRLEHAAHLLVENPEYSIAQVAADSGFGSGSYFSERFRRHYGMSPSDFRTSVASAPSRI